MRCHSESRSSSAGKGAKEANEEKEEGEGPWECGGGMAAVGWSRCCNKDCCDKKGFKPEVRWQFDRSERKVR
jgi:hypothetical protein